jgi:hypothetical protein
MALIQSPNIVTTGLIFAYDMQNNKKSWKGAPVTNSFNCPNPYDSNNNVSFIINGTGTFQRVYSGTYGGYTITPEDVVYRYNLGDGGCHYHGNSAAIAAGQYVCYSVDYYISPDASDYVTNSTLVVLENYGGSALGGGTGVSNDVTTKGKWQTIQGYSGPTAGSGTQAMFLYPGGCGGAGSYIASRGFILMKNPMFEFRSDVRYNSFVNGTRSNTQALLDLTNQSTITATSLTYASDGTFSFTGSSSDNATVGVSNSSTNAISRTWEAWVMPTVSQGTAGLFGHVVSSGCTYYCNGGICIASSNYQFNWYDNSNYQFLDSGVAATANVPVHVVGTYDAADTKCRIYINGVLRNTSGATNMSYAGAANLIQIGYLSASGNYYTGKINVIRHYYNKALTPSEIEQNFNAQRGRYGI